MNDYYSALGVPKTATKDEIKKAYRKLAHQYHPDKAGGNEKKFKEINEAYQVLGNDKKKAQYDQFGSTFGSTGQQGGFSGFQGFDFRNFSGFGGFGGRGFKSQEFDMNDIFSEFFGQGARTTTKTRQRGRDIQINIIISLEEAFSGTERSVSLKKYIQCDKCHGNKNEPGTELKTCPTCGGTGEIQQSQHILFGSYTRIAKCNTCSGDGKIPEKKCSKCHGVGRFQEIERISIQIPAGIHSQDAITLQGKGEAGDGGYGNLYAQVHVNKHPQFERDGDDIYSLAEISVSHATLGGSLGVKTLRDVVSVKIPGGIESGETIKLQGKGMPHLDGGGSGDHYVKITVKTPKKLSKRAKELFEELKAEGM